MYIIKTILVTGHIRTPLLPLVTGHIRTPLLPLVTGHIRTPLLPLVTGHIKTPSLPSLPLVTGLIRTSSLFLVRLRTRSKWCGHPKSHLDYCYFMTEYLELGIGGKHKRREKNR